MLSGLSRLDVFDCSRLGDTFAHLHGCRFHEYFQLKSFRGLAALAGEAEEEDCACPALSKAPANKCCKEACRLFKMLFAWIMHAIIRAHNMLLILSKCMGTHLCQTCLLGGYAAHTGRARYLSQFAKACDGDVVSGCTLCAKPCAHLHVWAICPSGWVS